MTFGTTTISSISQGPFEITLDIVFSSNMLADTELTNSANYTLTNGAYARKVSILSSNSVRVWCEKLFGYPSFYLTASNLRDSGLLYLVPTPFSFSIFTSSANLGNYNGLIRTLHDSNYIASDSERIYIAGAKGIDIIKKDGNTVRKWAQVYSNNNIASFFIANFPNDVVFSDITPPYISLASPASGDTVLPNTNIFFILEDVTTAVEVLSVLVYIDGEKIFDGNSGWMGVSGNITFGYKSLTFDIWKDIDFTLGEHTIRIVAEDLLYNRMDTSYSFTAETPFIVSGWGLSSWGDAPFGGV
jgi:hypothetical protein